MLFPGCGCCQTCNEPECTSCAEGCTWFDNEFEALAEDYFVTTNNSGRCGTSGEHNFYREKIGNCISLVCADDEWPSFIDDGVLVREFARPSGAGWKISVAADCLSIVNDEGEVLTSTAGVVIGGAYVFFHRGRFMTFPGGTIELGYARRCADGSNCCEGLPDPVVFEPSTADGEYLNRRLTLEIEENAGNFDVRMYDRGTLVRQLLGQTLTIPNPVPVGVSCTDSAKWKNLCITLTNGS